MSADWNAIKTEYITTDTSYRKLSEKYGVSRVQIGNVGKQEGWVELRRQHLDTTLTKTVEAISEQKVDRAARFQTVADKLLGKIEALVDSERPLDAKSLRALSAAMKDLKDTQGVKNDLDRREQEARIANLQKQAQKDDSKTGTVTVVLEGALKDYAQ